jgi:hypothetical protein
VLQLSSYRVGQVVGGLTAVSSERYWVNLPLVKSVNRKSVPCTLLWTGCRQVLLASLVALTTCGGRSQDDARYASGAASSGGSSYAIGGASATGDGTGGVTADASSSDCGDSSCDALFHEIQLAALGGGLGFCAVGSGPTFSDTYGPPSGSVVLNDEGKIVAATGLTGILVYSLADERWPCCANTTFYYWCSFAG